MSKVNGTVEAFNTKFGKYSILVNGTWYGTKEEWADVKAVKGDVVEFDDGGAKFMKYVKIVSSGGGASAAPAGGGSAPAKSSFSRGTFPIALEDGQRSIIRQNALTNARELVGLTIDSKKGMEDPQGTVALIIELAREFEAYTAGDIERYAAEVPSTDAFSAE